MIRKFITVKKIYAAIFLLLMTTLGISSVILLIHNKFFATPKEETTTTKKTVSVSFSEEYPFEDSEKSSSSEGSIGLGIIENYRNLAYEITDRTNTYLTQQNPFASEFQRIQEALCEWSENDFYYNGERAIVKLQNGYLAECCSYCPS